MKTSVRPIQKVLVVNAGSSSLKFMLFDMSTEQVIARGLVERIGLTGPQLTYKRNNGADVHEQAPVRNHDDALRCVCQKLVDPKVGVLKSLAEVQAIGHRVVHGGEAFVDSIVVTDAVKEGIRKCASLAPLHNPPNLGGIEACEHVFAGVRNVAVFDTAFHASMPPAAYLYAIPYDYYTKFGVRKYGFHGTSHKFVAQRTAEFLGRPLEKLNLITCHLGNGSSITAIAHGKVVDTSMGMTPLPGLVMGTRCGDIDPAVVLYLIQQGMKPEEVDSMLNKKSGLMGVAGLGTSDMRDIIDATEKGHEQAARALWMFIHRMVFYIGAYHAILQGADAIVFTGGIGENSAYIRERVLAKLTVIGCELAPERNQKAIGRPAMISTDNSVVKAVVMPTNEELMIARETVRVLGVNPRL